MMAATNIRSRDILVMVDADRILQQIGGASARGMMMGAQVGHPRLRCNRAVSFLG